MKNVLVISEQYPFILHPISIVIISCSVKALSVAPEGSGKQNVLTGKVLEVLDYGREKDAVVDVYGQKLTAPYSGNVGDVVDVAVPVEAVTIKDKSIDIIIV